MGLGTDILASLDSAIGRTGETLFEGTAAAVGPLAIVVAALMLVAVGLGVVFGAQRLGPREALGIMLRIIMVFMFGLSWQNFGLIYDALANGLQNLSFGMFQTVGGAIGEPTAVAAMDDFGAKTQGVTNEVIRAQSSITRGLIGGLMFVFLALFNAVFVVVVGFAKIMIAVLVAVAPLAILTILFEKTKNLFEAWISALVGYSLWPVAAAAVVATVSLALESVTVPDAEGSGLSAMLPFLVLAIVAVFAILQIPTAVANISGQINLVNLGAGATAIAGFGGAGLAKAWGKTGGQFVSGVFRGGKTAQQYDAATRRGNTIERGSAQLGGRVGSSIANSYNKSKSNIASIAKRKP